MTEKNAFEFWVERAMQTPGREHMKPVIQKELLHYDILFALDRSDLLKGLTFQGGTALRLCYGAHRFSEDLDFAAGFTFENTHLKEIKACLEHDIGKRYGLEVTVKEPSELTRDPSDPDLRVDKWQIRVVTSPGRPDLPKQMIKIEVAHVPAYSQEPCLLKAHYDFLPDGYDDLLIVTESLDEIMADKLIAFVSCQAYIRYRDIWDLWWLKQQGAQPQLHWVQQKIKDYRILNYPKKLNDRIQQLPAIIQSVNFSHQMARFLPLNIQKHTLSDPKFLDILKREIGNLFVQLKQ